MMGTNSPQLKSSALAKFIAMGAFLASVRRCQPLLITHLIEVQGFSLLKSVYGPVRVVHFRQSVQAPMVVPGTIWRLFLVYSIL